MKDADIDLIEEESLHDGIQEDLNRNDELIESIKKVPIRTH